MGKELTWALAAELFALVSSYICIRGTVLKGSVQIFFLWSERLGALFLSDLPILSALRISRFEPHGTYEPLTIATLTLSNI